MRRLAILPFLACVSLVACDAEDEVLDHHEHGTIDEDEIGSTSSALVATDPVSAVITAGCSAAPVRPLGDQLLGELECLRPKTMKRIDNLPGIKLNGASTLPYLQTSAADALIAAQKARGVTIGINSGLRTIVEQYLLNRLFQKGCPGIFRPAAPGTSNHESGLAIDIQDNAAWRTALGNQGFQWLGASDPVHFDYKGGGTVALVGLGVKSFQRLWNRNNPADTIAEDGSFGPMTEARMLKSPIGGFKVGALPNCGVEPDAGADAGGPTVEQPDETEPPVEEEVGGAGEGRAPSTAAPRSSRLPASGAEEGGGCAVTSSSPESSSAAVALAALGCAALVRPALRRRRRT